MWLAHEPLKVFRWHAVVVETDPAGTQTEHHYHQGDVGCDPVERWTHERIDGDWCFRRLRDEEFLLGKESRTVVLTAASDGSRVLHETRQHYGVRFLDYGSRAMTGLWRAFSYLERTEDLAWEGGATANQQTTTYRYDPGYGNLTEIREFDGPYLQRLTERRYHTRYDAEAYIVDRVAQEAIRDGQARVEGEQPTPAHQLPLLALTESMYDGQTTGGGVGGAGDLTLVRQYRDVPPQPSTTGTTLHSTDTSYGYDAYGNRTTATTYAVPGTRRDDGGSVTWSAPGNGSAGATTTTTYDSTFHVFPVAVTQPNGLVEQAGYDYRMGTLTGVSDPNGNLTTATYDGFGRLKTVVKPGDSDAAPTIIAHYDDWVYYMRQEPVRYEVVQLEVQGNNGTYRPTQRFYDGLGREIQTKQETQNGAQNSVVDRRFDGLGRVYAESQPRYVDETPHTTFYRYTDPGSTLWRATWTAYDGLNRPTVVTAPDGTTTRTVYTNADGGRATTTYDANNHATRRVTDALGRLRQVREYAGNSGNVDGQAPASATHYQYNPLDLLTEVADAHDNRTRMQYDALGRKLALDDPDMGRWQYSYDPAGNLVAQTDAKGQSTLFGYDALHRLTSKVTPELATTAWFDGFNAGDAAAWSWSGYQTAPVAEGANNVVTSQGSGYDFAAQFHRNGYSVRSGQVVRLRFKVDGPETRAHFAVESNDGSPRRVGVIAEGGALHLQYTQDGVSWHYPGVLVAQLPLHTWYGLVITLDDARGFQIEAFPEHTPAVRHVSPRIAMPAGKGWRFHHWIFRDRATIDDYREQHGLMSDSFDVANTAEWRWTYDQVVAQEGANRLIRSTGSGMAFNAHFYRRPYSLTSGDGVRLRFKLTPGVEWAHFSLEPSDQVRFGVVAHAGKLTVQTNRGDGVFRYPADLITGVQADTWYVLMLAVDEAGGLTALAYQETDPTRRGAYRATLPGTHWRFHHWIAHGTASIDDYREEQGAVYGYDLGPNGKGQRTSMANASAATTWQYDARGGVTREATHVAGAYGQRVVQRAYDSADRLTRLTYPTGEALDYVYDMAWRPVYTCSSWGPCYAGTTGYATYTALGQPVQRPLGNGLVQSWSYNVPMQRLESVQVAGGSLLNQWYVYDRVGNLARSDDWRIGQSMHYGYDHRDRLVRAYTTGSAEGAYDQGFSYDAIGNLTHNNYLNYQYPTRATARVDGNGGPHAVKSHDWATFAYDANGNMTSNNGRRYTWNGENQPVGMVGGDWVPEAYAYDAEGTRVLRTREGSATAYVGGLYEQDLRTGTERLQYEFAGEVIAQRTVTGGWGPLHYLHGDHLGSVAVATAENGAVVSRQAFTPWGEVRSGGVGQTTRNFTGQKKDGTGLLFYNARYYDPGLGRFLSADSIVPGTAAGSGGGAATLGRDEAVALAPLTVDFHEPGFAAGVNEENAFTMERGFWFELDEEDRDEAPYPWGPANPQALNRYSYTLNNPLRYTDPTGHNPVALALGLNPALFAVAIGAVGIYYLGQCALSPSCRAGVADLAQRAIGAVEDFIEGLNSLIAEIKEEAQKQRSKHPPGIRDQSNTKKEAYEKAKRAGNGNEPVNHPHDKHGPHYHPGDGKGRPLNHDHYKYPKHRR